MLWLRRLDIPQLDTNDPLVSSLLCASETSFGKSGTETDSSPSIFFYFNTCTVFVLFNSHEVRLCGGSI